MELFRETANLVEGVACVCVCVTGSILAMLLFQ